MVTRCVERANQVRQWLAVVGRSAAWGLKDKLRRRQAWRKAQLPVQSGAIYRPGARIRRHPIRTWLDPDWELLDPPSLPAADPFWIGSLSKFEGFGRVWQDSLRIYQALELYQSPIAQQGMS